MTNPHFSTFNDIKYRLNWNNMMLHLSHEYKRKHLNNTTMNNLTFEAALPLLKAGERLHRAGWNGKGMYVQLAHIVKTIQDKPMNPHFILITPKEVNTWVPSVSDILAKDWQVLATTKNLDSDVKLKEGDRIYLTVKKTNKNEGSSYWEVKTVVTRNSGFGYYDMSNYLLISPDDETSMYVTNEALHENWYVKLAVNHGK
jgi:hypothetical protein